MGNATKTHGAPTLRGKERDHGPRPIRLSTARKSIASAICRVGQTPETGEEGDTPVSVWPKHSKQQTFIVALCEDRNGLSASDLNCEALRLEPADIRRLEQTVTDGTLPHCEGGSFYGHPFQDERATDDQRLRSRVLRLGAGRDAARGDGRLNLLMGVPQGF